MAPWDFHDTQDEPLPRTYCITRTLLQMEEKKVVDEVVEHMMNLIKGYFKNLLKNNLVKHLLLKGKPLQMKKCLKNISMKKVSKKIPMKFLMLKT
jgi:hypothetical protein